MGKPIKLKSDTLDGRKNRRDIAIQEYNNALESHDIDKAKKILTQTIHVTNHHISTVIKYLIQEKIKYIVSPNEADAQCVYLNNKGYVDFVISDDSDLIAFGVNKLF